MSTIADPTNVTVQAEAARQVLAALRGDVRVEVKPPGRPAASVVLPVPAVRLLVEILDGLAGGSQMRVQTVPSELSVHEAAEILDAPDEFVAQLIDRGQLSASRNGDQIALAASDVEAFKHRLHQDRLGVLAQLTAEAQEMGLYD